MSDYKCIRSYIYAEHHEAFNYGQEISANYYDRLSAKGKMNFERKQEIQSSGSGLYESYTPPPTAIDLDSSPSSSWDSGSSSDSSSSFDFGGGDGGGGGSTGDW